MKNKMLSIGDKMPKFSLLDQDGNEVNYQDLQKKILKNSKNFQKNLKKILTILQMKIDYGFKNLKFKALLKKIPKNIKNIRHFIEKLENYTSQEPNNFP
jgi:translation elongation factor EF-1beta